MVYIYSNSIKNKKIQILRSNFMSSNDKNFEYNDNFESVDEQKNIYSSSNHKVNKHSLINTKKLKNRKIMFSVAIALSVIVGLIGGALIYAYKNKNLFRAYSTPRQIRSGHRQRRRRPQQHSLYA